MQKMHKSDKSGGGLGNGGKFDNAYDRAGVAQESFDKHVKNERSYVDEQLKQRDKEATQEWKPEEENKK